MAPQDRYPRFQIPTAPSGSRAVRVQGNAISTAPPAKPSKVAKKTAVAEPQAPEPPLSAEEVAEKFVSTNPDHYFEIVELRFSDMQIDPRYQRSENPSEIRNIRDNFRPEALGTPVMSARLNADTGEWEYFVLDGQQRRAGGMAAGYDEPIPSQVHYHLTLAEEAQLFLDLNYRKDVTAADKFMASLIAENPNALAIKKVLDDLEISLNNPRGFSAVVKALAIIKRKNGLAQLRWALETIQSVYDDGTGGVYDGRVVDGFVTFLRHREAWFTQTELERKLRNAGDLLVLTQQAETFRKVHGGHIHTAIANSIIRAWNSHRSKKKMPFIGLGAEEEYEEYGEE